jgi:hypothetical protein
MLFQIAAQFRPIHLHSAMEVAMLFMLRDISPRVSPRA